MKRMNRPKPLPSLSSQMVTISGNACHHGRWHHVYSDSIKEGLQTQPAPEGVVQEDVMSELSLLGKGGEGVSRKGNCLYKA